MVSERRRAPVSEALRGLKVVSAAARLDLGANPGPMAAAVARTAVELACANAGAAVIITRQAAAGAALRGARDVGAEPRIVTPRGGDLLSARTPLSLALQGERKSPGFAAASAFVADFVATRVAAAGLPAAQVRSKVLKGLAVARDAAVAALDFAGARPAVQAMFSAQDPVRKAVVDAISELERSEAACRPFRVPVPWATLTAPSATGRRAAVFVDLSAVGDGERGGVLAIALASLSAGCAEVGAAMDQGPLLLVCDQPTTPLGRFAAQRLARPPEAGGSPVLALFLTHHGDPEEPDLAASAWDGAALALPSGTPLPLAPAPEPADPLTVAEARALTPLPLRQRLLGGGARAEESEDASAAADAPADPASEESLQALRAAAGDLETLARLAPRHAAKPKAKREGNYEASDFEI